LCKLTKLDRLELSSNQNVDFNTFNSSCLSGLRKLELANTDLKRLKNNYHFLRGLVKLEKIYLPENNLGVFCVGNFPALPALAELDINENSLESIDAQELKRKFPKLKKIHSSKNFWSCVYWKSLEAKLKGFEINVVTKRGDENCNPTITATPRLSSDACESRNGGMMTTPTTLVLWILFLGPRFAGL
jgi:Leucine-rich repeat (LRR) protein